MLQQPREIKDWEMDWMNITQNILNEGTEMERFYIYALECESVDHIH